MYEWKNIQMNELRVGRIDEWMNGWLKEQIGKE